ILELREHDPLATEIGEFLSDQPFFLGISAPNPTIASEVSQISLAMNLLKLLLPLMYALEAPIVLVASAELVHTRERLAEFISNLSKEALVNAYTKIYQTDDDMFSAGMHALGYPDVQIPFTIVDVEQAAEVIKEFQLFEVINEIWNDKAPFQFR